MNPKHDLCILAWKKKIIMHYEFSEKGWRSPEIVPRELEATWSVKWSFFPYLIVYLFIFNTVNTIVLHK